MQRDGSRQEYYLYVEDSEKPSCTAEMGSLQRALTALWQRAWGNRGGVALAASRDARARRAVDGRVRERIEEVELRLPVHDAGGVRDALRREGPATSPTAGLELVVELIKLPGGERLEPEITDPGDHVSLEILPVGVPGRCGDRPPMASGVGSVARLDRREPFVLEPGGDRQLVVGDV
jgi:hypothetical protein